MKDIFQQRFEEAERNASLEREHALENARCSLRRSSIDAVSVIAAARAFKQAGQLRETLKILQEGIARCPGSPLLYEYYIERLEKSNRTEEAIAIAREASRLFPGELIFPLREALLLPVLYDTPEHAMFYRERFGERLERMIHEVSLDTEPDRKRALNAVSKNVNKYLAYQGRNDRDLQTTYGNWVHRIVTANFPRFLQPPQTPDRQAGAKLRVGYLSARFRDSSATRAFLGWIRELDRDRFAVFAYHAGSRTDSATDRVKGSVNHFREMSGTLHDEAAVIRNERLDVLVFLDVGMEPHMTQLAALRLAPVQCVAWDHPVTSGLPSIDYFLSADAVEPPDAWDHYSEQLHRLPGLGIHYEEPSIPRTLLWKSRADFGLRADAVVYLLSQTIFKYLPEQDALFARIAARVPNSQFVFLVTNEIVRDDLERRLKRAFAHVGVDFGHRCLLLPEMQRFDYWTLHRISDVVLDTIGWSGGISTFEAVALGIPVVTLRGKLMRGRQSAAILSQLGVDELIAGDQDEYADIAVRAGQDPLYRHNLARRMESAQARLYSDTRCVRALEDFFERVSA